LCRQIRQSFKLYILFFFVVVVVEMAIKYFDSRTEIPTTSIIIATLIIVLTTLDISYFDITFKTIASPEVKSFQSVTFNR
jgi:hypothetical protein